MWQFLKGFSPLFISSNFPAILLLLTNQHSLHTHSLSLSFMYNYFSIIAEVRSELDRLQDHLQLNLPSSNPLLEPPTNIHCIANASYGSAAIMCLQLFSCCDNLMIYDENSLWKSTLTVSACRFIVVFNYCEGVYRGNICSEEDWMIQMYWAGSYSFDEGTRENMPVEESAAVCLSGEIMASGPRGVFIQIRKDGSSFNTQNSTPVALRNAWSHGLWPTTASLLFPRMLLQELNMVAAERQLRWLRANKAIISHWI